MKRKIFAYTVFIFILVILQSSLFDYLKVYNAKPNLLIVLIISVAILTNNVEGAVIGFFCGLTQDIISGKILGFYALLGLYLGLSVGSVNRRLYRENFFIVIFFTFISTVLYEYTVYLMHAFITRNFEIVFPLQYIILPEALYNCAASIFIFIAVIKLQYWFESTKKVSRKY